MTLIYNYNYTIILNRVSSKTILFILKWLCVTLLVGLLAPDNPAYQSEPYRLRTLIGLREFDFVAWEAGALLSKFTAYLTAGEQYLDSTTRQQLTHQYLELIGQSRQLTREIQQIYADSATANPMADSTTQQTELAKVRAEMARIQPLVEAIIQEQVAELIAEEGFDVAGVTFPPVQMQMTPLPLMLIVSPRAEIRQLYSISLVGELSVPAQNELENQIATQLNLSALVVPIGGLGIYPAMVLETSNLNFLMDTVAHEWAHHWLTLRPLGIRYGVSPALRTINETTASIFGTEMGARVVERYYPDSVPALPSTTITQPPPTPTFDFRATMHQTRLTVDQLLAEGKIEQAESYMEAQRQLFIEQGYTIRKLNQAYFAFYGAYADSPGATGDDPIGPAITTIRNQSPTLYDFMQTMSTITNLEELQQAANGK